MDNDLDDAKENFDGLVGRNDEITRVEKFLSDRVRNHLPGSMYLSGAPGTGKTATVRNVLHKITETFECKSAYLNCMEVRGVSSAFGLIFDQISCLYQKSGTRNARKGKLESVDRSLRSSSRRLISEIENFLTSLVTPLILVLDEIDQLETKDHAVLYRAFGWSELPHSKLVLIGVANSLDLTERLLPKLKLLQSPQLIQFQPYQKDDVAKILKHKLLKENGRLDEKAVELCARKVSALTGDIRKALGVCQVLLDKERQRDQSQSNADTMSACRHVLDAVNDVYASPVVRSAVSLPLQSKLMLAAILSLSTHGHKSPPIKKIYEAYKSACKVEGVPAVSQLEAQTLCEVLSDHGLVSFATVSENRRKRASYSSLHLLVDEKSVRSALNDEAMISNVLMAVSK